MDAERQWFIGFVTDGNGAVVNDEAYVHVGDPRSDATTDVRVTGEGAHTIARLIAAAPELLEALKQAVDQMESRAEPTAGLVSNKMQKDWRDCLERARAAIAKAVQS